MKTIENHLADFEFHLCHSATDGYGDSEGTYEEFALQKVVIPAAKIRKLFELWKLRSNDPSISTILVSLALKTDRANSIWTNLFTACADWDQYALYANITEDGFDIGTMTGCDFTFDTEWFWTGEVFEGMRKTYDKKKDMYSFTDDSRVRFA